VVRERLLRDPVDDQLAVRRQAREVARGFDGNDFKSPLPRRTRQNGQVETSERGGGALMEMNAPVGWNALDVGDEGVVTSVPLTMAVGSAVPVLSANAKLICPLVSAGTSNWAVTALFSAPTAA